MILRWVSLKDAHSRFSCNPAERTRFCPSATIGARRMAWGDWPGGSPIYSWDWWF